LVHGARRRRKRTAHPGVQVLLGAWAAGFCQPIGDGCTKASATSLRRQDDRCSGVISITKRPVEALSPRLLAFAERNDDHRLTRLWSTLQARNLTCVFDEQRDAFAGREPLSSACREVCFGDDLHTCSRRVV